MNGKTPFLIPGFKQKPAHSEQVIVACAFIHHKFDGAEKVFLARRTDTKSFLPGVYEIPGGHVEYREDIIDGLKREVREELGMEIRVGDSFAAFTDFNEVKKLHFIEVIYFAEFVDPIENIKINREDHSEFGWFAENEIEKVFSGSKGSQDPEVRAIKKGFSLLHGNPPLFR